jgi:hypothetical protein
MELWADDAGDEEGEVMVDVQMCKLQMRGWEIIISVFLGFCRLSKTEDISIQSAFILKKIEV